MTDEYHNDCIERLLFPREIKNRPGLSHINYRIGTYSDFRETLFRKLDQDPLLTDWTHREADDPGIALLEGAAIAGDILTFYQELYANEAYLRCAQWRDSITDLVRLLGYRLSPGLGGKAIFAFELKGDKPIVIPAGFPLKAQLQGVNKAVDFETREEAIAYPELSQFNLYRPLYSPKIQGTTKEFYVSSIGQNDSPAKIEQGDHLLIGFPYPPENPILMSNSRSVMVSSLRMLHGFNLFKIKGSLGSVSNVDAIPAYKLGRSFKHFGHNAPRKIITFASDGTTSEDNVSCFRYVDEATSRDESRRTDPDGNIARTIISPQLGKTEFPMDSDVDDLFIGTQLIIQGGFYGQESRYEHWVAPQEFTLLRTIVDIKARSMTWGAVTGSATVVTLNYPLFAPSLDINYRAIDIRTLQFHEINSSELYLRAAFEKTGENQGKNLYFYGTDDQVQNLKGRQLLFEQQEKETSIIYVTDVQSLEASVSSMNLPRRITLDQDVNYEDFPKEDPKVTVYGNLAEATQGKSEKETVLGNGNNREVFQTFKLPKSPLTYFRSRDETPAEIPEIDVYVNDRLWQRESSFFGHGSKKQIYIVREDADGYSWVQFGDGKTGARLPSGVKNITARYRTGTGAYGLIKEGMSAQAGAKLDRLKKVYLPGAASGGDMAENGDHAREAAPGKVQSLGRMVSLGDFESEALGIAGVAKASAGWRLERNIPTVVVTALMEHGRKKEGEELQGVLNSYNSTRGANRFPVSVHLAKRHYVYLQLTAGVDPTYRQNQLANDLKTALGVTGEEDQGIDGAKGLFGVKRRRFGEWEYATRVEGIAQNIKGVVWAKVSAFGFVRGDSDDPLELSAPEITECHEMIVCDPLREEEAEDVLLCLHSAHFTLTPISVNPTEVPPDV